MSALNPCAGKITLCLFFLLVFDDVLFFFFILVFLVRKNVKKKKTYNTEYLRKEIHVTLTTSLYCQTLSINTHLWTLSSPFLSFFFVPPAKCSAS